MGGRRLNARDLALIPVAKKRIKNILRQYSVASKRMLEAKISEAGPGGQRVDPFILTQYGLAELLDAGEVEELLPVRNQQPALYALPALSDEHAAELAAEADRKDGLHCLYGEHSRPLGNAAESIIRTSCIASPNLHLVRFGDFTEYNGAVTPTAADGLVLSTEPPPPELPAAAGMAVMEIKNRREWIYHDNQDLWELLRAAFTFDVVGVFIARRIALSAFKYTFKRVGAIGIETFHQFAPPDLEPVLSRVRDKGGLGFHDITFDAAVPASVQKRIDALGARIYVARKRMLEVRDIVEPYLATLGDVTVHGNTRRQAYAELDRELKEHDFPPEPEPEPEYDYEDYEY